MSQVFSGFLLSAYTLIMLYHTTHTETKIFKAVFWRSFFSHRRCAHYHLKKNLFSDIFFLPSDHSVLPPLFLFLKEFFFLFFCYQQLKPSTITHPLFIFRKRRAFCVDLLLLVENGGGGEEEEDQLVPPLLYHFFFPTFLWWQASKENLLLLAFYFSCIKTSWTPSPWATPLQQSVYTSYVYISIYT